MGRGRYRRAVVTKSSAATRKEVPGTARRRAVLLAGAGLFLAAQLTSGSYRSAIFARALRATSLGTEEARRERLAPVDPALIDAVAARTARGATILLVTVSRDGADRVLYHRALVELAPRRVLWAAFEGPRGWPVFHEEVARSESAVSELARRHGADAIVGVGAAAEFLSAGHVDLPGRAALVRVGADR
jgi:hypothetical protein